MKDLALFIQRDHRFGSPGFSLAGAYGFKPYMGIYGSKGMFDHGATSIDFRYHNICVKIIIGPFYHPCPFGGGKVAAEIFQYIATIIVTKAHHHNPRFIIIRLMTQGRVNPNHDAFKKK
jgi:hypothetical protein